MVMFFLPSLLVLTMLVVVLVNLFNEQHLMVF